MWERDSWTEDQWRKFHDAEVARGWLAGWEAARDGRHGYVNGTAPFVRAFQSGVADYFRSHPEEGDHAKH